MKQCNNCKKELPEIKHSIFEFQYGNPILKCPYCGSEYLDTEVREISISGIKIIDKLPIRIYCFILLAIGALGVYGLLNQDYGFFRASSYKILLDAIMAIVGIGGGAFAIFSDLKGYRKRKETLENLKIESEKRAKDEEFISKLRVLGYKFPAKKQ